MAGDDHRTSFHMVGRNRHLSQAIQSLDHTLKISSVLQVDDGILRRIENIAATDDVGAPEKYHAVAVGRGRLMQYLDRFTIEIEVLLGNRIGVVWPASFPDRR